MTLTQTEGLVNSTTVRTNALLRAAGLALRTTDRFAPQLAARLAANLFLTPRRSAAPPRERDWIRASERRELTIKGRKIVTRSWGDGAPVLLIHGWEGRGSQLGAFAHSEEASGYRWIGVDLPAHGESTGKQTNLIEIAAVIRELVEDLNPSAIIAHSFGAAGTTVALSTMTFDGRLVYIAPPEDFNFFTSLFGSMLGIPSDLANRMQREIEQRLDVDWSKLRGTALARTMSVPLLVIHDEEDNDVPYHFGRSIADAWPNSTLLTTRGLGHRRILRDEKVIATAMEFLSSARPERHLFLTMDGR